MLVTDATCTRIDTNRTHFYYLDRDLITVVHIAIPNSRCDCDPRPSRGDLVMLVRDRVSPNSSQLGYTCVGVIEQRPNEEGIIVETSGDIWDLHDQGYWICITTNGMTKVNKDHRTVAIMGKGIALEAARRFPNLPVELGHALRHGNLPSSWARYRIVTFPTKDDWRKKSDLNLIVKSYKIIASDKGRVSWKTKSKGGVLCIPRHGCGNGGLEWGEVRRALLPHWNIKTVIVTK
jgi:hypothetical protein